MCPGNPKREVIAMNENLFLWEYALFDARGSRELVLSGITTWEVR